MPERSSVVITVFAQYTLYIAYRDRKTVHRAVGNDTVRNYGNRLNLNELDSYCSKIGDASVPFSALYAVSNVGPFTFPLTPTDADPRRN